MNGWGAWDWVDAVANILQIVSAAVVGAVFVWSYFEYHAYHKARRSAETERPWGLVIGSDDISGTVVSYLNDNAIKLIDLEKLKPFGTLTCDDDYYQVLCEVQAAKRRLTTAAATEVHLFYKGPVTLATGIGMALDNWVPIRTYSLAQGNYSACVLLDREIVKGAERKDMISPVVETIAK